MRRAPPGAVDEEHIRPLRAEHADALETLLYVSAGQFGVRRQHLQQLAEPLLPLLAVRADERVHTEDVHLVVVRQGGLLLHPLAQPVVVDDMIAAHEPRQVEGLAGRIEGHRALPGVLAHALGGHVLIAGEDDVRPDLVGDHIDVVLFHQLHVALHLPALPDAPAGVVRRAEDGRVYVLGDDAPLHVLEVHAPDAAGVPHQRAEHHLVAVVGQRAGEADVGRRVQQHLVPARAEHVQRAHHAAEDAVFIAYVLFPEAGDAVAPLLPADDGGKILLPRLEIAVERVLRALDDGRGYRGGGGEVHVRYPHGDGVEALARGVRHPPAGHGADALHGERIPAAAVYDGCKVVLHGCTWPFFCLRPL